MARGDFKRGEAYSAGAMIAQEELVKSIRSADMILFAPLDHLRYDEITWIEKNLPKGNGVQTRTTFRDNLIEAIDGTPYVIADALPYSIYCIFTNEQNREKTFETIQKWIRQLRTRMQYYNKDEILVNPAVFQVVSRKGHLIRTIIGKGDKWAESEITMMRSELKEKEEMRNTER